MLKKVMKMNSTIKILQNEDRDLLWGKVQWMDFGCGRCRLIFPSLKMFSIIKCSYIVSGWRNLCHTIHTYASNGGDPNRKKCNLLSRTSKTIFTHTDLSRADLQHIYLGKSSQFELDATFTQHQGKVATGSGPFLLQIFNSIYCKSRYNSAEAVRKVKVC